MNKHSLQVRTWRDRVHGNPYFSFKLAIPGFPVIIRPMEYGSANMATHEAFRELQVRGLASGARFPSEVLDVDTREVSRSDMFAHEWECIEHDGRVKPRGMRWANSWRRATGEHHAEWLVYGPDGLLIDGFDSLTAARQSCTRAMAGGATARHIERAAYNLTHRRGVPWASYLQVKP